MHPSQIPSYPYHPSFSTSLIIFTSTTKIHLLDTLLYNFYTFYSILFYLCFETMMKFLKIVFVALSIFFVFDVECGHGVAAAFIVPSSSTAPPGESLSFASSLFQKQQRMSEANFRLDYIQGINRSPYNKNKKTPPSIVPVEDDDKNEHIKKEEENFVYGRDSTCYRGLTRPTKACLALATVIAGGMVATNPELQHIMSLSSLTSLLDSTKHFIGDDTTTTLSALVERLAFRWDMSGLSELPTAHQVSDQWHEGLVSLSSRFDGLSNQIDLQAETMKEEFAGKMAATQVMMDQVFVNGKEAISQQNDVWQQKLASTNTAAKIEQWQQDLVQATDYIQGETNQFLTKGKEIVEESSSNFQYATQVKMNHWQDEFLQGSSQLRLQADEAFARGNDVAILKSSELEKASQMQMVQMKHEMLQMNTHAQTVANQLSTQAKDIAIQTYASVQTKMTGMEQELLRKSTAFQEDLGILFPQKYSEFQQLSQVKISEAGDEAIRATNDIRGLFTNIWNDVGLKRKEISDDFVPMIQDSSRFFHDKTAAFQEASVINVNKAQENLASQLTNVGLKRKEIGDGLVPMIQDSSRLLHDKTNAFQEASVINVNKAQDHLAKIASISREDSATTESAFLKTILINIVY